MKCGNSFRFAVIVTAIFVALFDLAANRSLAQEQPNPPGASSTPTRTQAVPDVAGIRTEILSLPTPTTPRDGEPLMAILYYPEAGINPHSPAILFHHGGLGGHPARQVGAPRFAAERLAAKGYTVLSIMSRISRGYPTIPFEDSVIDIKAGLDFLEARGMEELILGAHSLGSITITHYMATTNDPRVKAQVHFAPTGDMHGSDGGDRVDGYAEKVKLAQAAVAAGRGASDYSPDPTRTKGLEPDVWIALGPYLQTPDAFLSYWGPTAPTRNSDWFRKLTTPILMLAGTNDNVVPPGRMEFLKSIATRSPRVDFKWYSGGNHFFEGYWDQSSNDVGDWLVDIGLGARSRVTTELVDTAMPNGRHLPGVLYRPEGDAKPDQPAFILLHGWTGDILHSSNHWLAWRLAQKGYTVLAPGLRTSGASGIQTSSLADVAADLGAWVEFMEGRGFDRIIAEGHSAGGIWWSNYLSLTKDPRVVGVVYLAPTRDMPQTVRDGMGREAYEDTVAEAKAAVARGEGRSHLINRKYYAPTDDRFPGIRSGALQLASAWLDYWGPESRAVHTARVKEFAVPSLSIAGGRDSLMTKAFINQFTKAHRGRAESLWYDNATHGFRESKNRVSGDIVAWVDRTFPTRQSAAR